MEEHRRVADYFLICGLPPDPENQSVLNESSLEVNLKPSHNQEPITDITVIFPGLGENIPDYYQLLDTTPSGLPADLNHGSFRAPEAFICFRRGVDKPPLVDLGVLYEGRETPKPGFQLVYTPKGHTANVNNSTSSPTYIVYKRASDKSPCNELVITELTIIVTSKGEVPPHSFLRIDKNLNNSMIGSAVYLCFKKSLNRPEHISMHPVLLDRFPLSNNPSFPLEENISLFCLPMGATLECWPSDTIRTTTPSTFVLTMQNFTRVYGSVISFYEDYPESKLTDMQKTQLKLTDWKSSSERRVLAKKCMCFLSRWPFFEAFEKFLFFLYKRVLMGPYEIPLERYISYFLNDVPFPSPERPRILVQLSKTDRIALYQAQELPLPRSGANFRDLISTLGPDNSALLLLLALTEQKILIHSLRSNLLTAVAEAMMQIIFPFTWQCPYIPLCPVGKSDFISAPFPFVIGLDTRFFDLYELPSDVNAVDLDTNTISLSDTAKKLELGLNILPRKPARILRNTLVILQDKCHQYSRLAQELEMTSDDGELDFEFKLREKELDLELEIQEAFLHFMAGVLGGYRQHLLPITRAPTAGVTDVRNLFDRDNFIKSRDKQFHPFYDHLMNTQLFTKFIEECSFVSDVNQSLAFFDECVDRLSRGEDGRLLDWEGVQSDTTIYILPPDSTDLPPGVEYKYSTLNKLDHSLFLAPSPEPDPVGGSGSAPGAGGGDDTFSCNPNPFQTPSSVAKRTKQEIRSAVRVAQKHAEVPLLWSKCMLATSYSLWYLTLPAMVLKAEGSISTLRSGYSIIQRMQRLRLHPVDEICYRVMMQLCGIYSQPVLAVKLLFEMKRCGVHPNAVTYGYYNKAVLESEWPQGIANSSQLHWNKLRNVLTAVWLFKQSGKSFRKLEESVSQLSLDSQDTAPTADDVDTGEEEKKEGAGNIDPASSQELDNNGQLNTVASEDKLVRTMTRSRSLSIVKPPQPKEDEEREEIEPLLEQEEEEEDEEREEKEGGEGDSKPQLVRYTDIRNKFPNLIESGAAKSLFKPDEKEGGDEKDEEEGGDEKDEEEDEGLVMKSMDEDDVDGGVSSKQHSPDKEEGFSRTSLSKVPVTQNDPLGALTQPTEDEFRTPSRDKGSELTHRSMSMSDVLGEPFRTPTNQNIQNNSHMQRSCTMPLRGELGASTGELRTGNGIVGSLSSLAGSGLKSIAGSKAANLGLRKGKALLSGWMSPQTQVSTKDALNTIKTWSNSAATNLSKKYEEMVSPAPASTLSEQEEDKVSQSSTDSRRTGVEQQTSDIHQDTWYNLAEALGNYLWGETVKVPQPQTRRAADITEQFEALYSRSNLEEKDGITAISVYITSTSRCIQCGCVLFDEEIMAGWTAEDSNLNTVCCWCKSRTVPSLSIQVLDYREHLKDPLNQADPKINFPISIPYISPLVLRKELESVLHKEGDVALIDPACPDLHPILFWNLLYFFHRIATPSHLPDLLLDTPSLNTTPIHPSWDTPEPNLVKIVTKWDNVALYNKEIPLHVLWRQRNCQTNPLSLHPLMQSIISGVKENNLLDPFKAILADRKRKFGRAVSGSDDVSAVNVETPTKSGTPTCQSTEEGTEIVSIYRQMLFVTLVALGQDNIDLTAFDREYRRAFEKLNSKQLSLVHPSDYPPGMRELFCRKLFRDLRI